MLCECGCDEEAKPGNRFINGHNKIRGRHPSDDEKIYMMRQKRRHGNLKPNNVEKDFDSAFPELKFVGDFAFFVGSKNPDFILPDTNICVDIFGDRWHKPEEVEPRIRYFKDFGYDLTIVWEHEWRKQQEQVLSQINNIIEAHVS